MLAEIKRNPGIITSDFTEQEYMMESLEEYLEGQGEQLEKVFAIIFHDHGNIWFNGCSSSGEPARFVTA